MTINQDKVPINLEEALTILKEGLTKEDIEEITSANFHSRQMHFTVGGIIRNQWSLWQKGNILNEWFKTKYGVEHPDDISSIILECLTNDLNGKPRMDEILAKQFIENWKKEK